MRKKNEHNEVIKLYGILLELQQIEFQQNFTGMDKFNRADDDKP